MLTGDNRTTARAVAAGQPIDEVIAEVRPTDKAAAVAALREGHNLVVFALDEVLIGDELKAIGIPSHQGILLPVGRYCRESDHGDYKRGSDWVHGLCRVLRVQRVAAPNRIIFPAPP
jgi:hypothetical protein